MAIHPYTSHSAIHTQTEMQTEFEALKTHLKLRNLQKLRKLEFWNCSHVYLNLISCGLNLYSSKLSNE